MPNILAVYGDRPSEIAVVLRDYQSASCMSDTQQYAGVARLSEAVFAEIELRALRATGDPIRTDNVSTTPVAPLEREGDIETELIGEWWYWSSERRARTLIRAADSVTFQPSMQHEPQSDGRLSRWQLSVERTPTEQLGARDWAELLPFFQATYDVDRAGLEASISSRTYLVRVRERGTGRLVGTMAFGVMSAVSKGEEVRVFYGGDMLLQPGLRGSGLAQELAARAVLGELLRHPLVPHYGFAVALTPIMYLGIVRSFADMWPQHGVDTPADIRLLMDTVGRTVYPDKWRSADEPVVVGRRGHERELEISDGMLADPDVRYFVERNPSHASGTALPFVIKIDAKNLAALSVRSLRKLLAR